MLATNYLCKMKTAAYEARVENGVIHLLEPASLPEHTRVIVVVPDPAPDVVLKKLPTGEPAQILSPRLTNPDDAQKLAKRIVAAPRR